MRILKITHKKYQTGRGSVLITLLAVTFTFSCQKYLDVKQTSAQSLISNISDCQLVLDNYTQMNTSYPSDGEAMADNYFLSDADYNKIGAEDRKFYTRAADAQRAFASPQWLFPYMVVNNANLVLEGLNKVSGADEGSVNSIKGQALFFRAYAFFQVAQLYCKPYTSATAAQDMGIPLRLSSDISKKSTRSTLKETYDQIVGDFETAASLLPASSPVASRPNKAAAYAALARTYLAMSDYVHAGSTAGACLALRNDLLDYNTLNANSATPFAPRFNKEVIFQSVTAGTASHISGGAFSVYGATLDPSKAKVDPALYASFDANDLRKRIFFKPAKDAGAYKFTGNYEPSNDNTYFSGLATDEIYLIRAECYARAGNATAAMADLNTLLRTRWIAGSYVDMTATGPDDGLNKVLTERRKELLYRGLRWSDLRRLNLESRFQLTLTRTVAGQNYTLPPNDLRYVQLIPAEVMANSSLMQNPR